MGESAVGADGVELVKGRGGAMGDANRGGAMGDTDKGGRTRAAGQGRADAMRITAAEGRLEVRAGKRLRDADF